MRSYRKNSEGWYQDTRSLWKRFRQYIIWVGGWEEANGKGWRIKKYNLLDPFPVSLLGHWITFYGWGLNFRVKKGWFVVSWRHEKKIYISCDGTPSSAHYWIMGTPKEISEEAIMRKQVNKLDL